MVASFRAYLTTHGSFTAAYLARIEAVTLTKKLKRRQHLLQAGDVCRYQAFVVSGLLRLYRAGPDAPERSRRFAAESWWMRDLESFRQGLPAKGAIEAPEDSGVLPGRKKLGDSKTRGTGLAGVAGPGNQPQPGSAVQLTGLGRRYVGPRAVPSLSANLPDVP